MPFGGREDTALDPALQGHVDLPIRRLVIFDIEVREDVLLVGTRISAPQFEVLSFDLQNINS